MIPAIIIVALLALAGFLAWLALHEESFFAGVAAVAVGFFALTAAQGVLS